MCMQAVSSITSLEQLERIEELKQLGEYSSSHLLGMYEELSTIVELNKELLKDMEEKYKEVFDKIKLIEELDKKSAEVKEHLKSKMGVEGIKKLEGRKYSATYTAPHIRRNLNAELFYNTYLEGTEMYGKYVTKSDVKESIKITKLKEV